MPNLDKGFKIDDNAMAVSANQRGGSNNHFETLTKSKSPKSSNRSSTVSFSGMPP